MCTESVCYQAYFLKLRIFYGNRHFHANVNQMNFKFIQQVFIKC